MAKSARCARWAPKFSSRRRNISYAYTQPVREGRPYNLYHGNLEARAIDAKTTKLLYTLVYDLSLVAGDDAAKAADVERRRTAFNARARQHEDPRRRRHAAAAGPAQLDGALTKRSHTLALRGLCL